MRWYPLTASIAGRTLAYDLCWRSGLRGECPHHRQLVDDGAAGNILVMASRPGTGAIVHRRVVHQAITIPRRLAVLSLVSIVLVATSGCGGQTRAHPLATSDTATPVVSSSPALDAGSQNATAPERHTAVPVELPTQLSESVGEPDAAPTVQDPFNAIEEGQDDPAAPQPDEAEGGVVYDLEKVRSDIMELVGDIDGDLSIVVALPDGTQVFERSSTDIMESASLYKLSIMVELFRERDAGELSFDESIVLLPDYFLEQDDVYDWDWIGSSAELGTLLENMLIYSSNVAAAALLARLGNDAINQTMDDIGLVDTRIRWTPGIWVPAGSTPLLPSTAPSRALASVDAVERDTGGNQLSPRAESALNVTTARDIASLYLQLISGEVVSSEASAEMLDLLALQQINDRLPRYLPDGTIVAHKTGNSDGLVHDAGVIWSPGGPIVVVVLSDMGDEGRAVEIIAGIALEAYLLEP